MRKDVKRVARAVSTYMLEGPLEQAINTLRESAEGLTDVTLEFARWDDGYIVTGHRPMTEREKAQATKTRERARATAERRRQTEEDRERKELTRLQAKYGEVGMR